MRIDEAVKEQSGKPDWPVPEPLEDQPRAWLRLDCPFCTGQRRYKRGNTAAVNYDAGWFSCFRCDRNVSAGAKSIPVDDTKLAILLNQFKPQIVREVRRVVKNFGDWVDRNDLLSKAAQLVWGYAYRPYGDPNDAGMLDEWESDVNGNQDELAGYVAKALYGDLMNYAQSEMRWKIRTHGRDITVSPLVEHDSDEGEMVAISALDYLVFHSGNDGATYDAWTRDALSAAEMDVMPFTSWGRPGCDRGRNGLWHTGECCDRPAEK